MSYQLCILLALLILVPGLTYIIWRWPQGGVQATFSQHVALQKTSAVYYFGLFAIVLPILFVFFERYFVPTLQLPNVAMCFIAISAIAQIACTLIPETGGRQTMIHQMFAGISAVCLLPILFICMFVPTISLPGKIITGICLAAMLSVLLIIAMVKNTKLPILILQAGYYAAFFISILVITF